MYAFYDLYHVSFTCAVFNYFLASFHSSVSYGHKKIIFDLHGG